MRRGVLLLALCGLGLTGCKRHDMYTQQRSGTWDQSRFFPNGLSMRPPAPGAVPVQEDDPDVPQPARVTQAMLARGAERFDIFCTPCHGRTGDGDGMIVQRGFPHPPSFNSDRLRAAKAQHFYDVITNGYGVMYSYASRVPSYLSAWLFVLSVPAGALLLATGIEAFSGEEADEVRTARLLAPLRALLPLLPLLAVCGVPVLLAPSLADPHAWSGAGFGRSWFAHGVSGLRGVLFLLLWSGLALVFAGPGTRRGLAGLAFAVMLVTGTLAAFDWAMSVEPGLASSAFGLLLLSGQAVSAASLAILVAGRDRRDSFRVPILVLLWVWAFLHFSQFLVVWSGNQPDESAWYLHRLGGLGGAAICLGALLPVLALGLLPGRVLASRGWPVALVAVLALLVQLLQSFWLVTPAFRGRFVLTLADALAAGGLVALSAGLWWAGMLPRPKGMTDVGG